MADKDEQQSPGSKGPKAEEAQVEAEAAEAKAEAAAEKPKRAPRKQKAESRKQKAEGTEAQDKPKPKRAPRKRADAKAKAEVEAAKEEAAAEETEAEAAEAEGEPEPEDEDARPKAGGRRGGAAAAGSSRRSQPARRSPDGDVTVRARAKYVRCAPRKARLVVDHIRGKDIAQARAILVHTPRAASRDVLKLLDSAIANAENNHDLVADDLKVGRVYVDEGPTLKRFRPRALGRATRIRKRTSHMTIELVAKD